MDWSLSFKVWRWAWRFNCGFYPCEGRYGVVVVGVGVVVVIVVVIRKSKSKSTSDSDSN